MSYVNETVSPETSNHEAHLATIEIFFKQLVVAINFAKPVESTLKVAAQIAQLFNAKVCLIHAITPPMYQIDGQIITQEVLIGDTETRKEDIKKLIDCSEELKRLRPEIRIDHSEPVDFIVRVAQEIGADLIVVGSHGASGLERLALGSTAEAVLRRAQCPVLIVGPHYYARKPKPDIAIELAEAPTEKPQEKRTRPAETPLPQIGDTVTFIAPKAGLVYEISHSERRENRKRPCPGFSADLRERCSQVQGRGMLHR